MRWIISAIAVWVMGSVSDDPFLAVLMRIAALAIIAVWILQGVREKQAAKDKAKREAESAPSTARWSQDLTGSKSHALTELEAPATRDFLSSPTIPAVPAAPTASAPAKIEYQNSVSRESNASTPVKSCAEKKEIAFLTYPVKGVFAYENEIFHNLMKYNPEYDMTKTALVKEYGQEVTVYKWIPKTTKAQLVPEPDNKYDPNAIKVVVGDVLVGYIPKERCAAILRILAENRVITAFCEITGGAYKQLIEEDYDYIKGKSTYVLDSGRENLAANITIKIRTVQQDPVS